MKTLIEIVFAIILIVVFFVYKDRIFKRLHICPHKAVNIIYEEAIIDGEHHTFRHYVCFDCNKTIKIEKLQ